MCTKGGKVSGGLLQISWRRLATTVLGCAFLWLCLKSAPLALTRGIQSGMVTPPAGALLLYALYAIVLLAAALGMARAVPAVVGTRRERVLAAACAVCGACGLVLLSSNASFAALLGALVLVGAFIGSFLAFWTMRLADLPSHAAPTVIALSYALAELLRFVVSLAGVDAIRPLFPLVALAFLLASPLPARASVPTEHASLSSMSWGLVLTCALLVALWSFALGMLPNSAGAVLSSADLTWSYGFSFVLLSAMALFFGLAARKGRLSRQQFLYPFTAVVVVYLLIVTGMLTVGSENFVLFKRAFIAIAQCLEAFGLMVIVFGAAERKLSPIAALALFVALCGCELWMVVSSVVQAVGSFGGTEAGEWVAFALSGATTVILIVYLLKSATGKESAPAAGEGDAQRARCERAGAAHGLSAKEQEVAQLLYRGLSAKRIAEELFISENTVRSHTANIYKKLNVHSKQELIQLIDGFKD